MNPSSRFNNKVVLITGGASGIGYATAERMSSEGAKVVLVDFNSEALKSAADKLKTSMVDKNLLTSTCDVSKPEQVASTMNLVLKTFGHIDVIVNCAGIMIFKSLVDHTAEDWIKVLGVDLLGTFYFTQQGFLHMKDGSAIVNVSSIHAVETTPMVASYAASKAAVVSLTRTSAIEGKAKGIRVNAILPGAVSTPMLWENPNIKAGLEVIKQTDVGTPQEIAAAIAYLASNDAGFIQGASLRVDGGRLAQL